MYSQCPECLTRFRVTAAALRAAHGTVRCGRCGSAFDALPRLSDTLQVDGPASACGEPVPPGATGAGGLTGATAVGLLSAGEGGSGPEFHFSADDIEQVFIDVRDWQSRFGASSSPGDRAGRLGDTSSAELVGFLQEGETGEEDEAERDANDPPVWVHEPEIGRGHHARRRAHPDRARRRLRRARGGFPRARDREGNRRAAPCGDHRLAPRLDAVVETRSRSCPRSQPSTAIEPIDTTSIRRDQLRGSCATIRNPACRLESVEPIDCTRRLEAHVPST